jgi:hypothetical protein
MLTGLPVEPVYKGKLSDLILDGRTGLTDLIWSVIVNEIKKFHNGINALCWV